MQYARCDGDTVIELREIETIPPHKASLWRPVVIEGNGSIETTTVEDSRVLIQRSEPEAPPAPTLPEVKARLIFMVDADAEKTRLRYITPGAGQAMTYLEKHNQAVAVHELGQSSANALTDAEYRSMFPTLAASVGVEAPTLWDAAQLVIARYEAWATISYAIERAKLAGKKAISDASDAAAARAAYEAITWPTP
jgi:hypothetical protein